MKTIKQVIDEWKNRRGQPKYRRVEILHGFHCAEVHRDVVNLVEYTSTEGIYWTEFDSLKENGKWLHVKVRAPVIYSEEYIDDPDN